MSELPDSCGDVFFHGGQHRCVLKPGHQEQHDCGARCETCLASEAIARDMGKLGSWRDASWASVICDAHTHEPVLLSTEEAEDLEDCLGQGRCVLKCYIGPGSLTAAARSGESGQRINP